MSTTDGGDRPEIPDSIEFDEAFVRGAAVRELTAEDRARRARRVAEQEAAAKAARKQQRTRKRLHRRAWTALHRAGNSRTLTVLAVFGLLAGGSWYYSRPGTGEQASWSEEQIEARAIDVAEPRPTPSPAATMTRLGTQPQAPAVAGEYRFLATQAASDAPVTYDPCRVIHVVVNERTRPPEAAGLLEDAFETIGLYTGLRFDVEGTTDETYQEDRPDFQPDRYGDRWAPVLVDWTDDTTVSRLHGAAGFAGSHYVESRGRLVYVTGAVTLDGPLVAELLRSDDDSAAAWVDDFLQHELGHLVGLDHVESIDEVMFAGERGDHRGFGPGDRRGLYEAGAGRCVETL